MMETQPTTTRCIEPTKDAQVASKVFEESIENVLKTVALMERLFVHIEAHDNQAAFMFAIRRTNPSNPNQLLVSSGGKFPAGKLETLIRQSFEVK